MSPDAKNNKLLGLGKNGTFREDREEAGEDPF